MANRHWYSPETGNHAEDGDNVQVGIDWVDSDGGSYITIAPKLYRWDKANTDNYGSKWWVELDPETDGSHKEWGWTSWGSGYGTREIDSFATRTYYKKDYSYNITIRMHWDENFGTYIVGSGMKYTGADYCTWSYTVPAIGKHKIHYVLNGGEGDFPDQTKLEGTRLYLHKGKPTRYGYTFGGWKSRQGTTTYQPGDWTEWDVSQTLDAVWIPNLYEIVFDGNGGLIDGKPEKYEQKEYDTTVTFPTAQRKNYKFLGWSRNKDGSGELFTGSMKVFRHEHFYAAWELTATCYIKQNGVYKPAKMFVKDAGTYKTGVASVKSEGKYKATTV